METHRRPKLCGHPPQVAGLLRPHAGGRWRGRLRNSNTPKAGGLTGRSSTLREEKRGTDVPKGTPLSAHGHCWLEHFPHGVQLPSFPLRTWRMGGR